jgi:hypothetical protein
MQGLTYRDIWFTRPLDRCRYIGTSNRDKPQWLKDNPGAWGRIADVQQEADSPRRRVESQGPVEAVAATPSPQQPKLATILPETDAAASLPGDEIAIGTRRYVSAERAASLLGISRRTLSRRCAAGNGPPKIKIGNKAYFEIAKVAG